MRIHLGKYLQFSYWLFLGYVYWKGRCALHLGHYTPAWHIRRDEHVYCIGTALWVWISSIILPITVSTYRVSVGKFRQQMCYFTNKLRDNVRIVRTKLERHGSKSSPLTHKCNSFKSKNLTRRITDILIQTRNKIYVSIHKQQ